MRNAETTRAEIYELARLLRLQGDRKGAKQVLDALIFTEEAAALTGVARLEQLDKESHK
jgi:hypothetical protein